MKYQENIKDISMINIDFIGFIFYEESQRFVQKILPEIPNHMKKVGVFVNSKKEDVIKTAQKNRLDYIQLHGDEKPEFCCFLKERGIKIIKAFRLDETFDFRACAKFEDHTDLFLFDTKTGKYGGSGKKFNWAILSNYKGNLPFLLSGGIQPENYKDIQALKHEQFAGVDLNSGFEKEPGLKDVSKIKTFINHIKKR